MNDRELETLLRQVSLAKPSFAMDAKVMGLRPQQRLWPALTLTGIGAAAAAVLLMLLLGYASFTPTGDATSVAGGTNPTPSLPHLNNSKIKILAVQPLDEARGPSALEGVRGHDVGKRQQFKVTYADEHGAIHIETVGKPHEGTIIFTVPVK